MEGWAVGVAEAGVEDAGGGDEAQAGGDGVAAGGLTGSEDGLGAGALLEQRECGGDVGDEDREGIATAEDAGGERGGGVRGAFEPDGVRVGEGGGEAGGVEDEAVDGLGAGERRVRRAAGVGGFEVGEGPVDGAAGLVAEGGHVGPGLAVLGDGGWVDGDLVAERAGVEEGAGGVEGGVDEGEGVRGER